MYGNLLFTITYKNDVIRLFNYSVRYLHEKFECSLRVKKQIVKKSIPKTFV